MALARFTSKWKRYLRKEKEQAKDGERKKRNRTGLHKTTNKWIKEKKNQVNWVLKYGFFDCWQQKKANKLGITCVSVCFELIFSWVSGGLASPWNVIESGREVEEKCKGREEGRRRRKKWRNRHETRKRWLE